MYLKSLVYFLLGTAAEAALIHPLNDLKVIEVPISQTGLTRITVKEDRISNVFGVAGEYVMEPDETKGQVFIRPLEPVLNPISITVTTEGGRTQDLRLVPKNQVPEAIILAEQKEEVEKAAQTLITRNEIEDLLYAISEGRIPVGYQSVAIEIPAPEGPYRLISEVKSTKLHGLTYEVKNWGPIPWILAESGFARKLNGDVIAVLMSSRLLKPGESAYVYVATKSL
ncbi:MAG: type-F conjugative transfer system secretin TraK [Bacillota bacterium]|nr:type-F conjugative transfer system secretin TraK [Bacillota bacterium]